MLTRADRWLIGVVFFFSLLGMVYSWFLFSKGDAGYAEIYVDGRLHHTIRVGAGLHEEIRVGDTSHFNIIEATDGRVRVREADCPDQVCVQSGWIGMYPQQLVCVPYRVVVKIVNRSGELDDISR